jgi:hypothetical protein
LTNDQATQVHRQLEHILCSPRFARKPRLGPLLAYIVKQTLKGSPLKEVTIGMEVFGLPASFRDDKDEAIVRGSIVELRETLADYYQREGRLDEVLIQIKKGRGYETIFEFRPASMGSSSELSPSHTDTAGTARPDRGPMRLWIEAECNHFENTLSVEPTLRLASGDPSLRVTGFRIGSVIIEFECTEKGAVNVFQAFESGALAQALGANVLAVDEASTMWRSLLDKGSAALTTAYSPSIDLLPYAHSSLKLGIAFRPSLLPKGHLELCVLGSEHSTEWITLQTFSITLEDLVPNSGEVVELGTCGEDIPRFVRTQVNVLNPVDSAERYYSIVDQVILSPHIDEVPSKGKSTVMFVFEVIALRGDRNPESEGLLGRLRKMQPKEQES